MDLYKDPFKEVTMKTGLVMEGGAMRGMFTCGVIDTFLKNNISFDGAIGVSAGAAFGCNFKSKQIGRALRYNKRFCKDKRYCSPSSFFKTGDIFNADFCYRQLPDILDPFDVETFRANPMEFWCVATDVLTGKAVYHKCTTGNGDDYQWFRASASMPLVSNVVEVGGYKMLDGGMADSIPLEYFEQLGYDRIVVILTQPNTYRKKPNRFLPLVKLRMKEYPNMIEALAQRHIMYNHQTEYVVQKEKEGKILVIRPKESLHTNPLPRNANELQRVYNLGVEQAEASLNAVIDFLHQE